MYRNLVSVCSFISPQIWEMMLLNCQFQFGKEFNVLKFRRLQKNQHFFRRLLWDAKHLFGYTMACIVQYIHIWYSFVLMCGIILFPMVFHLYAVAMAKDMKNTLKSLEKNAKIKENNLKAFHRFCDFVKLHSTLKQLSCLKNVYIILQWSY